jgi:putative glycosyltransferase (TIGR04372 family)
MPAMAGGAPIIETAARLLAEGLLTHAEPWARIATIVAPDDWRGAAILGSVLARQDRSAEAATVLAAACRAQPLSPDLSAGLGHALGRLGRPEPAIAAFRTSLIVEPARAMETAAFAAALLAACDIGGGAIWLQRALTLDEAQLRLLTNLRQAQARAVDDARRRIPARLSARIGQRVRERLDRGRSTVKRRIYYLHAQSNRLGHLAHELYMLRATQAQTCDEIVVLVHAQVANPAVLEMFSRGMVVETPPDESLFWLATTAWDAEALEAQGVLVRSRLFDRFLAAMAAGRPRRHIALEEHDHERGRALRRAFGIRPELPLVTLHVREAGMFPNMPHHNHRDADIASYLDAIAYLTSRGHHVVRLGDPSMARLPDLGPNVIDLPFHAARAPLCDLHFIAASRFFVGTFSGPLSIALALGIPSLILNCAIEHVPDLRLNPRDRIVPKHYLDRTAGRYLTQDEVVARQLDRLVVADQYERLGIELVALTSAEVARAVIDMDEALEAET